MPLGSNCLTQTFGQTIIIVTKGFRLKDYSSPNKILQLQSLPVGLFSKLKDAQNFKIVVTPENIFHKRRKNVTI